MIIRGRWDPVFSQLPHFHLAWFSKPWLGYSGLQLPPPKIILSKDQLWAHSLLEALQQANWPEHEPHWEVTPKATKARKPSREWHGKWFRLQSSRKTFHFPSWHLLAVQPWTCLLTQVLSLNYKAKIRPTLPHCHGDNAVYGGVCVCVCMYIQHPPPHTYYIYIYAHILFLEPTDAPNHFSLKQQLWLGDPPAQSSLPPRNSPGRPHYLFLLS